MRYLKRVLWALAGIYVFILMACFAEFHIWRSAQSYPVWLAKPLPIKHYPPSMSDSELFEYMDKVCGPDRGMIAFDKKTNGHFVRCDDALTTTAWWHGVYLLVPQPAKK